MWNCWKATSIDQTPELDLAAWKIYEVSSPYWEGRTRHFSGYNLTEMEGRASNVIVEFDKDKLVGKTKSGRVYKLINVLIGLVKEADADYVWAFYVARNQLFDIVDVTSEYK